MIYLLTPVMHMSYIIPFTTLCAYAPYICMYVNVYTCHATRHHLTHHAATHHPHMQDGGVGKWGGNEYLYNNLP